MTTPALSVRNLRKSYGKTNPFVAVNGISFDLKEGEILGLLGPNGSGKTPIMKGIVQGLGHEVELPPDVLTRCEFAELTLIVEGRYVVFTPLNTGV